MKDPMRAASSSARTGRAARRVLVAAACGVLASVAVAQTAPQTRACLERVQREQGTVARADLDIAALQRHAAAIQRCHVQAQPAAAAPAPAARVASVDSLAQSMARRGGNCAVMADKLLGYRQLGRGHPWVESTVEAGVRYGCL